MLDLELGVNRLLHVHALAALLNSIHACFDSHANRLRIMSSLRLQCVATKTVFLFTLLLLFSPSSAQEPGELMNGLYY